jgi:hypothetical protein
MGKRSGQQMRAGELRDPIVGEAWVSIPGFLVLLNPGALQSSHKRSLAREDFGDLSAKASVWLAFGRRVADCTRWA